MKEQAFEWPDLEIAEIFRKFGPKYQQLHWENLSREQLRAMQAIQICRTAALGGHVDECDHCGYFRISYNSCRNRHCPKCQRLARDRWVAATKQRILPIRHFHVVFTLPEELRPLALGNARYVYNLPFRAAAKTLQKLCSDSKHLGAQIGLIVVLHTWSQTLSYHPHVHCIVTGGGLSKHGSRWIYARRKFLVSVKVLSKVFRGKFLDGIERAHQTGKLRLGGKLRVLKSESGFKDWLSKLYGQDWVVYCKQSLPGTDSVIEYLARYTHRVAISNGRLVKLDGRSVTFRYRDSNNRRISKEMTLDVFEFIRRFLLHILPCGFMKIRHYGLLSNANRKTKLVLCHELLGHLLMNQTVPSWKELLAKLYPLDTSTSN